MSETVVSIPLSIVVPTYKERENLITLIPEMQRVFADISIEIVVVDDHSDDGTREIVKEFTEKDGRVVLIERPGLLGLGSALRDGYNAARGEFILSSDADSFTATDMRRLYEKAISGFDMVLGYKTYIEAEMQRQTFMQWCRTYLFSEMSNKLIGLISGIGLKNYNTNFRIIRTSTWRCIKTREDRHFFLLETILKARKSGARIAEIPVVFRDRRFGESKVSFFGQAPVYFLKLIRYAYFDRS